MTNRIKLLRLPAQRLIGILEGKLEIQGLPKDARIITVQGDWMSNSIRCLVHSAEYEEVPEGMEPPDLEPMQFSFIAACVPKYAVEGFDSVAHQEFLEAFALVDQQFGEVGKARNAWNTLKQLLQPVCFHFKDGSEKLVNKEGRIKFREFV